MVKTFSPIRKLIVLFLGLTLVLVAGCGSDEVVDGAYKKFENPKARPVPVFSDPAAEDRFYSITGYPVSDFITMHGDTINSDEVAVAIAPDFEMEWQVESDLYIAEGPVFDSAGNSYVAPMYAGTGEILVSLAPDGSHRWSITSQNLDKDNNPRTNGCGSPLVLNDLDNDGKQIIYIATYDKAWAIESDTGNIVWEVFTGLSAPDMVVNSSYSIHYHNFGVTYDPVHDAIVGSMGDGHIIVLDRATGDNLLAEQFSVADTNSPAVIFSPTIQALLPYLNGYLAASGILSGYPGSDPYAFVYSVLLGFNNIVANYFSINPATGQIYVAATSPDSTDGTEDGVAEYGALYALSFVNGYITEDWRRDFAGGTGSSPSLRADGSRVYVGDNFGKVLAIDTENGNEIWDVDLGEQVFASITVSADNGELYCGSSSYITKLVDHGDKAEIIWRSDLSALNPMPGQTKTVNLLNGSVGANGVAVHIGLAMDNPDAVLPVSTGVGLLDRVTGKLRSFKTTAEESVAIMQIARDGSIAMGYSPIRRPVTMAVNTAKNLGLTLPTLRGGVVKFKPVNYDKLVKEAAYAAAARAQNAATIVKVNDGRSAMVDILQIKKLTEQCRGAASKGVIEGTVTLDQKAGIDGYLDATDNLLDPSNPTSTSLIEAAGYLSAVVSILQG